MFASVWKQISEHFLKQKYPVLINVRCSCGTVGCDGGDTWVDMTHAGAQERMQMDSETVELGWGRGCGTSTELARHTQTARIKVGSDAWIFNTSSPAGTNASDRVKMGGSEPWSRWPPGGLHGQTIPLMAAPHLLTDFGFPEGPGWHRLTNLSHRRCF